MTATADTTAAPDLIEAQVRRLMAVRAALPNTWINRKRRGQLLADVDRLLDCWAEAISNGACGCDV